CLAGARAEGAVGAAGAKAERGQRDLGMLAVEHRQSQAALARFRDLPRRLLRLALGGGLGVFLALLLGGLGVGLLARLVLEPFLVGHLGLDLAPCLLFDLLALVGFLLGLQASLVVGAQAGQLLLVLEPLRLGRQLRVLRRRLRRTLVADQSVVAASQQQQDDRDRASDPSPGRALSRRWRGRGGRPRHARV